MVLEHQRTFFCPSEGQLSLLLIYISIYIYIIISRSIYTSIHTHTKTNLEVLMKAEAFTFCSLIKVLVSLLRCHRVIWLAVRLVILPISFEKKKKRERFLIHRPITLQQHNYDDWIIPMKLCGGGGEKGSPGCVHACGSSILVLLLNRLRSWQFCTVHYG